MLCNAKAVELRCHGGRDGDVEVGQTGCPTLDGCTEAPQSTHVVDPVTPPPDLMPRHDQPHAAHPGHDPKRKEVQIRHVVGHDDVKWLHKQPGGSKGEEDALSDRASRPGVHLQPWDEGTQAPSIGGSGPPPHGVGGHFDPLGFPTGHESVVHGLSSALAPREDSIDDERDPQGSVVFPG